MYKKVRPQGNIMIEVFKCIGVSIIFITKNSYSNFKNCLVYLPKSEICHNMRTLESFIFFFLTEGFLLTPPDLQAAFVFTCILVYI